jgi:hypothetical protein
MAELVISKHTTLNKDIFVKYRPGAYLIEKNVKLKLARVINELSIFFNLCAL